MRLLGENWEDRDPSAIRRRHRRAAQTPSEQVTPRSEDGRDRPDPRDRADSRYSRDAYDGRRSSSGPERYHGGIRQQTPSVQDGASSVRSRQQDADRKVRKAKREARRLGKRRKANPHPVRRVVLRVLVALLIVLFVWMAVLDHNMHIFDTKLDTATAGIATPWSPYYVLVTGSDARGSEASRTDTIMLARIDPVKKHVTLISIPRDTRVSISGYGTAKINAAYAYGGASLCTSTVASFADVKIAHFFEVGFDGFADIVDAVGGITVDVPANTTVDDVTLPSGTQTLNGSQALVFVRCRDTYALGDFQRAANQRAFMVALASKMKQAPFWKWPGIITAVSKCIGTDAWSWQLFCMLIETKGIDSSAIYTAQVPSTTQTIDGVSYVITKDSAWATMMTRVNAGLDPNG